VVHDDSVVQDGGAPRAAPARCGGGRHATQAPARDARQPWRRTRVRCDAARSSPPSGATTTGLTCGQQQASRVVWSL